MTEYTSLALLIDGHFKDKGGAGAAPVIDPATGATLAEVPRADEAELDEAVAAAERASPAWAATTALERSAILRRAAQLIRDRIDRIAVIMTLEQGKPLAEAKGELNHSADVFDWYAEEGKRIYGRVVPSRVPGVRMTVTREPVGPAAAFTPWNFPALTPCRKIGGALAAGCTLVLKPSEEVPGTAVEIARALADAGLPAGVLNLVFGDPRKVSSRLIAADPIRKISFTGSTEVGRHLMRLAADGLKRTTMELGGHAPVLVFDDVDAEAVAAQAAAGKYRNAGQVCVSPTRFMVHEAVYDRFVGRFVEVAKNLRVGNGLDEGVQMGPLANPRRVEAMEALVQDARDRGGSIDVGGRRRGNDGWFYEPTVVTGIDDSAALMNEEPFGPVAPIVRFATLDEAIERGNRLPYGLSAYAFTHSASRVAELSERLRAGMVGINGFTISQPETPFGGILDSGHGSEGGSEGLDAYLNTKLTSVA